MLICNKDKNNSCRVHAYQKGKLNKNTLNTIECTYTNSTNIAQF